MSNILERLTALLPTIPTERDREEAYLAEALDVGDLERRMRDLGQRNHDRGSDVTLRVGLW